MTDKWEMCELARKGITFISPGKPIEYINVDKYMKLLGKASGFYGIILRLLDEGWEPYQTVKSAGDLSDYWYYLRRKLNS